MGTHHHHHHHHGHGHSHDCDDSHHGQSQVDGSVQKRLLFGGLLNLLFSGIEFWGGFHYSTVAVLSDAWHDLGDGASLFLFLYLSRVALIPANQTYRFGYRRWNLIGSFILAAVLLFGSGAIAVEAIHRFQATSLPNGNGMMGLAVVGILVNGLGAYILNGGESFSERALRLHLIEDILGWIAVLVGGGLIALWSWTWIDPVLSLGISVWVAWNAFQLLRSQVKVLLHQWPEELDESEILSQIKSIPGVRGVHGLRVWSLDGDHHVLSTHVEVSPEMDDAAREVLKGAIRTQLESLGISDSTLELEPVAAEECPLKPTLP
jgi:cobalt-zinc-cadmium efflux system protein